MPGKSMGIAPKELMASTMKVLPNSLAARPMASMGLSMPLVVSQCTTTTCVIDPIGRQRPPHVFGGRRLRFRILERTYGDRLHGGHFGDPLAVGPIGQDEELALAEG